MQLTTCGWQWQLVAGARSELGERDDVGGSNERCPLTLSFDAKNSRNEAERAFDCHIFASVKQLLN